MQAILTAAQEDNKLSQTLAFQSHELTRSMKNDSVAMKTVSEHSFFLEQLRLIVALLDCHLDHAVSPWHFFRGKFSLNVEATRQVSLVALG